MGVGKTVGLANTVSLNLIKFHFQTLKMWGWVDSEREGTGYVIFGTG